MPEFSAMAPRYFELPEVAAEWSQNVTYVLRMAESKEINLHTRLKPYGNSEEWHIEAGVFEEPVNPHTATPDMGIPQEDFHVSDKSKLIQVDSKIVSQLLNAPGQRVKINFLAVSSNRYSAVVPKGDSQDIYPEICVDDLVITREEKERFENKCEKIAVKTRNYQLRLIDVFARTIAGYGTDEKVSASKLAEETLKKLPLNENELGVAEKTIAKYLTQARKI